jgi:hypothetical protein
MGRCFCDTSLSTENAQLGMNMDRKSFLDVLTNKPLKGKKLFPDFPEGPRSLRNFWISKKGEKYEIYNYHPSLYSEIIVATISSITSEGFIISIDSIDQEYAACLESVMGKKIIHKNFKYYLEGKEYPIVTREQKYRYDEKSRDYYLYGSEPIVKETVWNNSIRYKVDKFLGDLRRAQIFYRQLLPEDVVLKEMTYNDLCKLYELYLKHGKEVLADPSIVTLNTIRWRLEIYKDLGALTITQRRVDP